METAQEYYRNHGPMTAPGACSAMLAPVPGDIAAACSAIQGTLIHRDLAPWLYDLNLSDEARDLANVRAVAAMLSQIRARSDRALTEAREPKQRMPAVCRHFATMFCGILREHGVPARARCGFGAYFNPGRFEDHWVGEYWNAAENRWILVDAQLDAVQRKTFKPGFDPLLRATASSLLATRGGGAATAKPIPTSSASLFSTSRGCGGLPKTSSAIWPLSIEWRCCPGTCGERCRNPQPRSPIVKSICLIGSVKSHSLAITRCQISSRSTKTIAYASAR
jgi:Transglutaminase-like superfamily